MSETDFVVVQAELRSFREDQSEMKGAMAKMADAIERLTRLEERHSTVANGLERIINTLSAIEIRVRNLELAQPVQKLTSGWVTNGIWAGGGALVVFVLKKVGVM